MRGWAPLTLVLAALPCAAQAQEASHPTRELPAAAAPTTVPTPEVLFVGLAAHTCINSRADPAEVRKDAEARGWTAIDPASAPGESPRYIFDGKVYTRTHAWQLQVRGTTYWVSQFDVPGQPAVRDCSVMAQDLDFEAVDAVFLGHRRDEDDRGRALPVRRFNFPNCTVMYMWSDDGEHSLHVISVTPKP